MLLLLVLLLMPLTPLAASGSDAADGELGRLRSLYVAAVADEAKIAPALREIDRLRAAAGGRPAAELDGVLTGYRGALITLRAKHATWPGAKLRNVREGLAVLDTAVERHPDLAEVRYLRLMSCYYLPGIFGRTGSVRDDFAALARLLPKVNDRYPPEMYATIVQFVLEKGRPQGEDRTRLESALGRAR